MAAARTTRFYFMLPVEDMDRAVEFYVAALGTEVRHTSPELSELHLGDVTLCLKGAAASPRAATRRATGLMVEALDLPATCAAIIAAGGELVSLPGEGRGPVEAADSEGNLFTVVAVDDRTPV